jgi:hypothetical protein
MRPATLPAAEHWGHGTRARYVAGCRCDDCREANRLAYHERQARAKAAAIAAVPSSPAPIAKPWTAPDGTIKLRTYRRACPGPGGAGCPYGTHLRKDSTGGLCERCRLRLVYNGLVPATAARAHLRALSRAGIGRRAVQAATDLSGTILGHIRTGRRKNIRASTEARILAVDAAAIADHGCVAGGRTWRTIRKLLGYGLTRGEIAQRLGAERPALQIRKDRVLAKTALKVERLLAEVERHDLGNGVVICPDCGFSHARADRVAAIRRMLPCAAADVREAWPCLYPEGVAGDRRLYRDIADARRTT